MDRNARYLDLCGWSTFCVAMAITVFASERGWWTVTLYLVAGMLFVASIVEQRRRARQPHPGGDKAVGGRRGRITAFACLAMIVVAMAFWWLLPAPVVTALCEAGLPNLSKPDRLGADAVHCLALGPRETLSGTIANSDHGSSLGIASAGKPIALFFSEGSPAIARESRRSWQRYCIDGATVTISGWRTRSGGPFGEMGFADEQFFVDTVEHVAPLPAEWIAQAGPDPRWCHRG